MVPGCEMYCLSRLMLYLIYLQIGDAKEIKRLGHCGQSLQSQKNRWNSHESSWMSRPSRSVFFPCFFFVIFLSIICNTWGRFDPFEILEVSPGASAAEVKKANLPVFLKRLWIFEMKLAETLRYRMANCPLPTSFMSHMSRINDVQEV